MRIAVVADGDPRQFSTNSGVAKGVLGALQSDPRVTAVIPIDGSIPRVLRPVLAALTFRPTRSWWWASFNLGMVNVLMRDRVRALRLRGRDYDLLLFVRNIHMAPRRGRYAVFIDTTSAIANREWRAWRTTPLLRYLRQRVERTTFQRAAFVFTAGAQTAENVIDHYGIARSRVRAIGGGLNFSPMPGLADFHRETPLERQILFVGTDFHRKGGDVLLEAFALLRERHENIRLVIAGPPASEIPNVEGVTALGRVDDRDSVARLYSQASVFCLPSRHEPYGLAIQEAMAFGIPCVGSRAGAIPTIIDDGVTGILVDSESAEELSTALNEILEDESRARVFGRNGREKVESELTWAAVVDRMLDSVLGSRRT